MGSVRVDRDACRGSSVCTRRAPRSFRLDDERKAVFLEPPGDDWATLREIVRSCPNFALHWQDGDSAEGASP